MRKIDFRQLFKNNWIHFLAIGLFIITTFIYFQPQFTGHSLKQHDIEQFKGMSNEINHFRDVNGEEPLWTNSMFGGMPTYQISTKYEGNLLKKVSTAFQLWLTSPAGMFFAYLLGFYIMLLCMKVNAKVAIFGAFAFAFSSYFIIILQAGHNTKAAAIGLAPPVIGAFYMAYRHNLKWGVVLSALFMSMQLAANHVQITFYLGMLLVFVGIAEFIRHIKHKNIGNFLKATGALLLVYVFALGINYGNLSLTNDYSKYTIRGGNDISINVNGTTNAANSTSGLDKDYVTQWSYGVKESMTLISPYVLGGSSAAIANSQFAEQLRSPEMRSKASLVAQNNIYWGDQPFTSGPVYLGIIVFFLAVLGMVYLNGPMKWALFGITVLTLMLSWGKNFMGLTDFFLDNVPFYNKFRAVTIILAIVELTIPLIAVLFLNKLFKKKEEILNNIKPFYIASAALLVVMVVLTFTGLGNGYLSTQENDYLYSYGDQVKAQLAQEDPAVLRENGIDINNASQVQQVIDQQMKRVNDQFDALIEFRRGVYQSSMLRSIFFLVMGIALVSIFLKTKVKKEYILLGLGLFVVIDLVMVDLNYLNNKKSDGRNYDHWAEKEKNDFPVAPSQADKQILEQEVAADPSLKSLIDNVSVANGKNRGRVNQNELWLKKLQTLGMATNYRVYEPSIGFNSSRASYFHKALNGYHGAKLRRIQNVKDFHINYNNMDVLNMLNVKYFIQEGQARRNPGALGSAWLVKELSVQPNANKELLALSNMFMISNESEHALVVNGVSKKLDTISGRENIVFFNGDSMRVDLSGVLRSGVNSSFVQDVNGQVNWIPTVELEKDSLNSFSKLLTVQMIHDFDPKNEAIIGVEDASQLSSLTFTGQGSIEMTSYAPNAMVYSVNVPDNQFAVFSEMYFPDGWNAYVKGEKVEIQRVNYLLRGLELPAGKYDVEMRFEVPKFDLANNISFAGSILLFIVMGIFFFQDFLMKNKEDEAA
ncbi:glycosyltransferase family protein [Brumimicrobium oceani]|uniref:YfhO family protein n=1 Tax=Brumimicrobium oceani TaxID=2100725 RepID=A0A2U2XF16_9FLAO|nr:hypothetical protein [Brumimicrobium oceani]PWH86347.1 hypothetical protein DIT68_03660 [Brumimicrobium oceani]